MAQTLYDKLWNSHVIHTEEDGTTILYIDRHLLHEVTSPQAFEGLKLAERPVWRISANLAVSDHNVPTTDRSARHRGSGLEAASRYARRELRCLRHHAVQDERPASGHRAHHRAGAGRDAAGHDDRLRRLAHVHARRVRRARARHRHVGSRARAGHANAAAEEEQEHAGEGRRPVAARLYRERHRARHHRQDRHGGRHGLRDRIRRLDDPRAVDGRPHDGLQHGDRSGRARRHGRRGRHHDRIPEGPSVSRRKASSGITRSNTGSTFKSDDGATVRSRGRTERRRNRAASHVGHVAGNGHLHRRPRAGSRSAKKIRSSATRWNAR